MSISNTQTNFPPKKAPEFLADARSGTGNVQDVPGTSGHRRQQENYQSCFKKFQPVEAPTGQVGPPVRIMDWSTMYLNP